jgi:hypothetical protein
MADLTPLELPGRMRQPRGALGRPGRPAWGYHDFDLSLAQDNLVSDVAAAEITWTRDHR